jgi:hypothetical protein
MHAQPTSKDRRRSRAALVATATAAASALIMLATAASASSAHQARPHAARSHAHALQASITTDWKLPALVAALLVLALGNWLAIRKRHRRSARPRHEIPNTALVLLKPIYRYDYKRDAWILRIIGPRLGPVLRPHGYGATPVPLRQSGLTTEQPTPTATPELFATATAPAPAPASARRSRRRPTNRKQTPGQAQNHEPPPLPIRRPPD